MPDCGYLQRLEAIRLIFPLYQLPEAPKHQNNRNSHKYDMLAFPKDKAALTNKS